MVEVLAIFGSKSDEKIYSQLMQRFNALGIDAELRVLSAHRTPEELEKTVERTDAKVFVAGAGMSAALPGVIASKTIKPVIGIPLKSCFQGLDAFLSTVQMPKGIPVLSTGVEQFEEALHAVKLILEGFNSVTLIQRSHDFELIDKANSAKLLLDGFKVNYNAVYEIEFEREKTIYLDFCILGKRVDVDTKDKLVVNVPIKNETDAIDAVNFLATASKNLWLGLNASENAALAAVQLLNSDGRFSKELKRHRNEMQKKVLEFDNSERKKL